MGDEGRRRRGKLARRLEQVRALKRAITTSFTAWLMKPIVRSIAEEAF
jgi:hypothetical protein